MTNTPPAVGGALAETTWTVTPSVPDTTITTADLAAMDDARAAAAWRAYWTDEAIAQRLREEIAVADLSARWRLREMSYDLSNAEDWKAMGSSIARAQVARRLREDGYGPCEWHVPDPWPPESLDKATWRETGEPSPNVPPHLRFRRHDAHFRQKQARREVAP